METFTPFATELLAFLIAQGLPTEVLVGVKKFDFSKTANMSFVHSIPGTHNAEDTMWTTGLPALAQAVNSLQMSAPVNEKSEVHFATSSLGSLDDQQIEMFSQALRGDDPFESLSKQSKPALRGAVHGLGQIDFKIVFPSLRTVENSKGGTDVSSLNFALRACNHRTRWTDFITLATTGRRHNLFNVKNLRQCLLSPHSPARLQLQTQRPAFT